MSKSVFVVAVLAVFANAVDIAAMSEAEAMTESLAEAEWGFINNNWDRINNLSFFHEHDHGGHHHGHGGGHHNHDDGYSQAWVPEVEDVS